MNNGSTGGGLQDARALQDACPSGSPLFVSSSMFPSAEGCYVASDTLLSGRGERTLCLELGLMMLEALRSNIFPRRGGGFCCRVLSYILLWTPVCTYWWHVYALALATQKEGVVAWYFCYFPPTSTVGASTRFAHTLEPSELFRD